MKIHNRDRPGVETVFVISVIFGLFSCCIATLPFSVKPDEVATVIGKAFTYKLPAEMSTHPGYTFKFHAPDSENLPSWLHYDDTRHLLLGVPSYHDKGSHTIQLDVITDETNKTADVFNFLTIEIVEYEEDINHFNVLRTNTLSQPGKNTSQSSLNCPNHAPVIVATLVFDLNSRKLSGSDRVKLLNSVSKWTGIDVDQHRWMPGKGEKTAFNLKDVVVLTAGPGWVKDAQERGVSVSWKIGCGDSITDNERSYISVSNLKSASQTGAFKNELSSPVVAWHVTYGRVKHRQVVRVRRQALAQTPVPTSTIIIPTASIITPSIVTYAAGTPTMSRSPTAFTVTPTATRISPSQTRTTVITTTPTPTPTPDPINHPPFVVHEIDDITAVINEPFNFTIPSDTFDDKEDDPRDLQLDVYDTKGNPLSTALWVQFDEISQTLNGIPKQIGETEIGLIVTDRGGLKSPFLHVRIKVVRTNKPPYLYNHIDSIPLYIDQPVVFKVPYDTFHDNEDGPTRNLKLKLTAVGNKDTYPWVEFDASSQTIYALPRGEIIGRHEFHLIAKDRGGKSSYDAFEFHVKPAVVKEPNHRFGLKLNTEYDKFEKSAAKRVRLCVQIGDYFGSYFNTSYKDIRVEKFERGSVILEWNFANIATNLTAVRIYKDQFVFPNSTETPVPELKEHMKSSCPVSTGCSVTSAYVEIYQMTPTTPDPNVVGRTGDEDDGTWWEYTIIPAFVIAALILIIGLIIIICIRCRRKSKLDKNEKVVFVQRKKPAVFREEYPMREVYGNQPLITPNEKAPLPPPAYPRSSTPTEDPSERLLHDSSPSYQAPFDSGHEPAGNSRPPVASYRLPPPYVAP